MADLTRGARPGLSPSSSMGFVVNRLARLFALALQRRISALGVAPAQFGVLLLLYERDGQTQSELARGFDVEQPTMANTLKRMERDGLVARSPDPSDRRRVIIRLTPKAQQLAPTLVSEARAVNAAAVADLSEGDLATFAKVIDALSKNLRQD